MKTKICVKCKATKDVNLFGRSKVMPDGFAARCFQCAKNAERAFRQKGGRGPKAYGWASGGIQS